VAESSTDSAALAKVALAQVYAGQGRTADAENLLKSIVNKPTKLVSKAQAQVLLAQLDQTVNPAEAKRIIQSLKSTPGGGPAVTRAVEQLTTPSSGPTPGTSSGR
jgi:predicted Zn-dependent protease